MPFKRGLITGRFSMTDLRSGAQSLVTVKEGPREDQVTLDWLQIGPQIVYPAVVQFTAPTFLPELHKGRFAPRSTIRALEQLLKRDQLAINLASGRTRASVRVFSDPHDRRRFALLIYSGKTLVATVDAEHLADGFSLFELVVIVVAAVVIVTVVVVALDKVIDIINAIKCNQSTHQTTLQLGGAGASSGTAPVGSGSLAPVTSGSGGGTVTKTDSLTLHKTQGN